MYKIHQRRRRRKNEIRMNKKKKKKPTEDKRDGMKWSRQYKQGHILHKFIVNSKVMSQIILFTVDYCEKYLYHSFQYQSQFPSFDQDT